MLVERDGQLSLLDQMLDSCLQGGGAAVLVQGGTGSGKSALSAEFVRRAAARGARCMRVDSGRVGTGTQDLLEEVATAADLDGPGGGLVEHPASQHVVVVDDIHHTDVTAEELARSTAHLQSTGALVVMLTGSDPAPALQAGLLRLPRFRILRLPPLTPSGVLTMVSEQLDDEHSASIATGAHAATGGNPLLVRALIEDLRALPSGQRLPVEPGPVFRHVVVACLGRASVNATRVATGIALIGHGVDPEVLAAVLHIEVDELSENVRTLADVGVLENEDELVFRSPATRRAVLSATDDEEAGNLRVRAAEVLHGRGVAGEVVARYLLAAGRAPDEWALDVLLDEAARRLDERDLDAARRCLNLAASQSAVSARTAVRLVTLGWLIDPAVVPQLLGAALHAVDADDRIPASEAIVLAGQLLRHGWHEGASTVMRQLAAPERRLTAGETVELHVLYLHVAVTYPALSGFRGTPVPETAVGGTVISNNDMTFRSVEVLSNVIVGGPSAELVDAAQGLLEACTLRPTTITPCVSALLALLHVDELGRAEAWADQLIEQAKAAGVVVLEASMTEFRGRIALASGDLCAAERFARRALASMPFDAWGLTVGAPLSTLVTALVHMGRFEEAADELARPVPPTMFNSVWGLSYLRSRALFYRETGGARAALSDFRSISQLMTAWDLDSPVLLPWRSDAADVHLGLDEGDHALRLLAEQAPLPGAGSPRLQGVAARLRSAAMHPKERSRLRMALSAVTHLEATEDRLELAKALVELSDAYRASGDGRRARMTSRRALHLAQQCQAELLVAQLEERFAQPPVDVPDDAVGVLSDAEQRVAELASRGDSNREIARTLYITISTVEQHLTRVYRKLRVRKRTDLPFALATPRTRLAPSRTVSRRVAGPA